MESIPSALSHHPTTIACKKLDTESAAASSAVSIINNKIFIINIIIEKERNNSTNNCRQIRETEDRSCYLEGRKNHQATRSQNFVFDDFWVVVAMCTSVGISASQLSRLRIRSCSCAGFSSTGGFLSRTRRSSGAEFQLLSSCSCSSIVGGRRRISSLATTLSDVTPRVVRLAATSKAAAAAAAAAGESDSSIVEGNGTADQLNTRLEEGEEAEEGDWSSRAAAQRRVKKDVASMRDKIASFAEKQSKYFWLGGPILITTAIVLPSAMVSLVAQLQKNFLLGVATAFGFDVLFVLAADAFFVLTDKTGHHQRVSSEGPPPWIGPWEYTGYPAGEPALSKAVSFAGVAIAAATLVLSLLVGKLGIALPALGPYLALIFAQVGVCWVILFV
jgi:hypothetical protein